MEAFDTCPAEIILKIASYLNGQIVNFKEVPSIRWVTFLQSAGSVADQQTRDILRLGQTCQRMHQVLQEYILDVNLDIPGHRKRLTTLEPNNEQLFKVLRLLNVRSATFSGFDYREGSLCEAHVPVSPGLSVDALHLPNCSSEHHSLTLLFGLIKDLRVLYFEADSEATAWGGQQYRPRMRSASQLINPLAIHASTLEKLVFTRTKPNLLENYEYPATFRGYNKVFTNLTSLSIAHVFLVHLGERDEPKNISWKLPPRLKELEVLYDDRLAPFMYHIIPVSVHRHPSGTFLRRGVRPYWLFWILQDKHSATPDLERIRIISEEFWGDLSNHEGRFQCAWKNQYVKLDGDWTESEGVENWRPPTELEEAFQKAGFSCGLFLNAKHRYTQIVPRGQWFDDDLEESWDWEKPSLNNDRNLSQTW